MEPIEAFSPVITGLWVGILALSGLGVALAVRGLIRGSDRGLSVLGGVLSLPLVPWFAVLVGALVVGAAGGGVPG